VGKNTQNYNKTMQEEISQQEIAAIAAAKLKRMQRSQQQEPITKVEPKTPSPAPAKQSKSATNSYWNKPQSSIDIVKNPKHVADIYTMTPWIPQPQVDDICAIAERPYGDWIDLEAQHIEGKWDRQRFIESAYNWPFRAKMRCVEISEDGLMATVSVSGVRKRLPLVCLWEMNEIVDTMTNSEYDESWFQVRQL